MKWIMRIAVRTAEYEAERAMAGRQYEADSAEHVIEQWVNDPALVEADLNGAEHVTLTLSLPGADREVVLSNRMWRGQQSWELERVVKVLGHRLRLRVDRDSYDSQSNARVERWTGDGWTYVTNIPIQQTPIHAISYVERDEAKVRRLMDETADALTDQALSILEG